MQNVIEIFVLTEWVCEEHKHYGHLNNCCWLYRGRRWNCRQQIYHTPVNSTTTVLVWRQEWQVLATNSLQVFPYRDYWWLGLALVTFLTKARFPLPELKARVDGWPVSSTCQHGPCWRARISTSWVDAHLLIKTCLWWPWKLAGKSLNFKVIAVVVNL